MKISIALASFNGSPYLLEQLESFCRQTVLPDELIVTDDGSTDSTADIVRDYAKRVPFSVELVINPRNVGYAQNFSKALSLCNGDLVFLSDQDDVWFDNKIETIKSLAIKEDTAGCFMGDALLTDGNLVSAGVSKLGQIRKTGLPDSAFVMGCCAAFRRDLLDILLPIPAEAPSHDNWLVEVSDILGLVRRIDEPLQYYRRHGSNTSQFFVNEAKRPSWLKRGREKLREMIRRATSGDSLDKEYRFYDSLHFMLDQKKCACQGLVGSQKVSDVVAKVGSRLDILGGRRAIRSKGIATRPMAILWLWRKGGYRTSGGLSGAIKDMLVGQPSP